MKICVLCPGSFTNGLDSPERGESRWSQNYAKMLAMAGHDVYAGSMGKPEPRVHYGAKLIHEQECAKYGPYDLYIDSSWWKDKIPYAKATKYVCLKWSLEEYTREFNFPDNFYLAYPYPSHSHEFYVKDFNGKDRCFMLPTMFGTEFKKPNWDKNKIFLPGKIDTNRKYKKYIPAITSFLNQYPVEGCSASFFQKEFSGLLSLKEGSNLYELQPYNHVMDSISRCKLSLPILNPGCIIEAAFMGTPSIFWEEGGFYNPLAKMLNVLIEEDALVETFINVFKSIMNNKKKYFEVTYVTQDYFSYHLYENALKYFNLMIETIF